MQAAIGDNTTCPEVADRRASPVGGPSQLFVLVYVGHLAGGIVFGFLPNIRPGIEGFCLVRHAGFWVVAAGSRPPASTGRRPNEHSTGTPVWKGMYLGQDLDVGADHPLGFEGRLFAWTCRSEATERGPQRSWRRRGRRSADVDGHPGVRTGKTALQRGDIGNIEYSQWSASLAVSRRSAATVRHYHAGRRGRQTPGCVRRRARARRRTPGEGG